MAIRRNLDDTESRRFWSHVEATAAEVANWQEWRGSRDDRDGNGRANEAEEQAPQREGERNGTESTGPATLPAVGRA
jgi:hypothetical protein